MTSPAESALHCCIQMPRRSEPSWIEDLKPVSNAAGRLLLRNADGTRRTMTVSAETVDAIQRGVRPIHRDHYFTKCSACPLCGGELNGLDPMFSVWQLFFPVDVVQCSHCSLVFKQFLPNDVLLDSIYAPEAYLHFAGEVRDEIGVRRLANRVQRMGPPRGRHLDYGCGGGAFVKASLQRGWDSHGADPYLPDISDAPELSGRLHRLDITQPAQARTLGTFDMITLWGVMEHLREPLPVLRSLCTLLRPGGAILFNAPWGTSCIARKRGSCWKMAILIEHVLFWTPPAVRWAAEKLGLRVSSIRYAGSPYPLGCSSKGLSGQGLHLLPCPVYALPDEPPPRNASPGFIKAKAKVLFGPILRPLSESGRRDRSVVCLCARGSPCPADR